jgi:hypothetical protein
LVDVPVGQGKGGHVWLVDVPSAGQIIGGVGGEGLTHVPLTNVELTGHLASGSTHVPLTSVVFPGQSSVYSIVI